MRARRSGAALALALALAAAATGCGEKGEPAVDTTTADVSTSKLHPVPVAFAAGADQSCMASDFMQERTRRARGGRQITLGDRARLLVYLAPERAELARDLAKLDQDGGDRGDRERALVATAQRRAAYSAEAGHLYESNGSHAAIAKAAAGEHDERERFVAIARRLGLAQCGEELPAADARAVRTVVERALGAPDAKQRCAELGSRYLEETYGGGVASCVVASPTTGALDVRVSEITGVAHIFAEARAAVTAEGGVRSYRVRLTYEDGGWRIDKLD